jgi:hypothetical protein
MTISPVPLAVLLGMSGIALLDGGDAPKGQPAKFKVTTSQKSDRVEIRGDDAKAVFSVYSPLGASQAVITRRQESWPKAVVLRLHLRGLWSFQASNGKVKVDASASIGEGQTKVFIWKDGKKDAPLNEKSPLWMEIRIIGGDGKPAKQIPLKNGYFEITLPKAFFEGNPRSIALEWIDFRNV